MRLALAVLVFALNTSCGAHRVLVARTSPPCELSARGDTILCGGAPFAEIVRSHCTTREREGGEAYLVPQDGACRFLGVRYADGARATLFAARSLTPWREGEYRPASKGEAMWDWAYAVAFDPASRSVTFEKAGTAGASRWSFDVGTGALETR